MFARMNETDHLMLLFKAKELFKSILIPRINTYEERLKKNWYERGTEYIKSGYGEEGYKRTKDFLDDIEKITLTEDLISLTKEKKYQQGNEMPVLLQCAVLEICKFDNKHVNLVEISLREKMLADEPSKYNALKLLTIRNQAIKFIYDKIISSEDYGSSYLNTLNDKLLKNTLGTNIELQTLKK